MRDLMLILHFLGLMLGPGVGVAMLLIWFKARKLPPEQKAVVMPISRFLSMVGPTGLLLLIISGFGLAGGNLAGLFKMGLFHVKLTLVFLLLAYVGYTHMSAARAARKGTPPQAAPAWLAFFPTITASAIVVLAVLLFH